MCATKSFAADTTDISGIYGTVSFLGDFKSLTSELDNFQWLVASQIVTKDDSPKGERLAEVLQWGQIGYQLNTHALIWLGYFHETIRPLNKSPFQANRAYEDFVWNQRISDFDLTIRTRLEERVHQTTGDVGYRAKQLILVNHVLPVLDGLSGYMSDEVWFYLNQNNFGKQGFCENRISAGLTYQFTPKISGDLGYLQQYIDSKTGNNSLIYNLQINLRYRF